MKEIYTIDVAVAIIVNKNYEALLQKKDMGYPWFPGKWCLFGGGIEDGEDPETALRRELVEELKFNIGDEIMKFKVQNYQDETDKKIKKGRQYVYLVDFKGEISDIVLNEGAGFAFISKKELGDIKINEHDFNVLKEYYSSTQFHS